MFTRLIPFVLLLVLGGCAPTSVPVPVVGSGIQIKDSLQRTVTLPAPAKRIVCLASSNTEILFALGLDAEVVGTTEFCTYPEAAKAKTRVGGFDPISFDLETIVGLKPDLVLAAGSYHQSAIDALERQGFTVAAFDATTFPEVYENIEKIGELTGRVEAAKTVTGAMKKKLSAIIDRVKGRPQPSVFYLLSDTPLMTAGPKSVINEAIELAGGSPIFPDAEGQYPRISDEELLRRDPRVILFPQYGHDGQTQPPKVMKALSAVREKRLYPVNADLLSRQTPRLIDAVEQIAELLHPPR